MSLQDAQIQRAFSKLAELKDTRTIDRKSLKTLVTRDYLDFCLNYSLSEPAHNIVLDNGSHVDLLDNGVIGFNLYQHDPKAKSIVISCGVHGNETAPIEICNIIIHRLLNENLLSAHRILFIFGNIGSMLIGQRFIEENLNRLFTREHQSQSYEGERSKSIMNYVDSFFQHAKAEKLHYDLHTAIRPSKNEKFAVYPFLHGREYSKSQLAFLSECEVNTILLSQTPTTTFSYYSSYNHQAHAFTVELGKVMPFGKNDMAKFKAVKNKLIELIAEDEVSLPEFESCSMDIFKVNQVINKSQQDFKLHFNDDIANFTGFSQGEVLASESGAEFIAQVEGEAIVFPNAKVEIGQRALLTVVPCEL